jgi:hypothetical protein
MKNNKLTPQETFMKYAYGGNLSPEERSDLRKMLMGGPADKKEPKPDKSFMSNPGDAKARQGLKLDSMGGRVPNVAIQQAKSGIHIKPENKGKFTAKAKAQDMGVQEYARKVMSAPKGKYSPETRRQANFAKNAAGWKKESGGSVHFKDSNMSADSARSYRDSNKGEFKKGGYAASGVKDYQYTNYSKKKV